MKAPDLATVKDFLRFYIGTSHPRLADRPTADSINTIAEWFFAGFTRVTGTDTHERERSEVYNVRCLEHKCPALTDTVGAESPDRGRLGDQQAQAKAQLQ